MRSILLPAIGDPVLSLLWIDQFKNDVSNSSLYVLLNSDLPATILDFVGSKFNEVSSVIGTHPIMVSHGLALRELFDVTTEDLVMLIEDDCFLLDREAIDKVFRGIEKDEYDMAGSPRGSCSLEILDFAKERWGLDYSGFGDRGCNFWPNCLFVKRSDLLRTDLHFGEKKFNANEYYPQIDHTFSVDVLGDTLVWMSLQLRNLNIRIKEIPQHHCNYDDMKDFMGQTGIFDRLVPWVHTGSSSSLQQLIGGNFQLDPLIPTQQKMEYERRLAWWILAYEKYKDELPQDIRTFVDKRRKNVDSLVKKGLSVGRINGLIRAYRGLL